MASKLCGRFLMLAAILIIASVALTGFVYVLPCMGDVGVSFLQRVMICLVGVFLLFNTYYNFFLAACGDSGVPPLYEEWLALGAEEGEKWGCNLEICKKCQRIRPPRTHHCSACNTCIVQMDHHCHWLNTCVGRGNHKNFLLLVFWMSLGCLYVIILYGTFLEMIDGPFQVRFWNDDLSNFMLPKVDDNSLAPEHRRKWDNFFGRCITAYSIQVTAICLTCMYLLGFFQFVIAFIGMTTLEVYLIVVGLVCKGKPLSNPYDKGWKRNFQRIFGRKPIFRLTWLLPWLDSSRSPSWSEERSSEL